MIPFKFLVKLNKLKFIFYHRLNNFLIGKSVNNILKNNIRSIIESYFFLKENIIGFKKIRGNTIEKYDFDSDFPIYFRREKAFSERYIFYLKDINLSIYYGLIWTKNKKYFQESMGSVNKMLFWNDVRPYISLPKTKLPVHIDNHYYFLPFSEFYHFILEEIPALLYAYKEHGSNLRIILNNNISTSYYREFLKFFFGDLFNKIIIEAKTNLFLEKIVIVQREAYSGFINSNDIRILNEYLPINLQDSTTNKVYVSRRKTNKRKMKNEIEIENILQSSGFQILYLEQLTIPDQIKSILCANVIIAPHGAGLSHLVWGNTNKKVLEIFPSGYINDCFAILSVSKGYDYKYLICQNTNDEDIIPKEAIINYLKENL